MGIYANRALIELIYRAGEKLKSRRPDKDKTEGQSGGKREASKGEGKGESRPLE